MSNTKLTRVDLDTMVLTLHLSSEPDPDMLSTDEHTAAAKAWLTGLATDTGGTVSLDELIATLTSYISFSAWDGTEARVSLEMNDEYDVAEAINPEPGVPGIDAYHLFADTFADLLEEIQSRASDNDVIVEGVGLCSRPKRVLSAEPGKVTIAIGGALTRDPIEIIRNLVSAYQAHPEVAGCSGCEAWVERAENWVAAAQGSGEDDPA